MVQCKPPSVWHKLHRWGNLPSPAHTELSDGGMMGSGTQRALSGTPHASILFLLFGSIHLFSPGLASGFPSWLLFSLGFCLPTPISLLHLYSSSPRPSLSNLGISCCHCEADVDLPKPIPLLYIRKKIERISKLLGALNSHILIPVPAKDQRNPSCC